MAKVTADKFQAALDKILKDFEEEKLVREFTKAVENI